MNERGVWLKKTTKTPGGTFTPWAWVQFIEYVTNEEAEIIAKEEAEAYAKAKAKAERGESNEK